MLDGGDLACAMEISSHALELRRAEGIHVAVAVFTNLTQDHLDFHPSMEDYFLAKRRLFASPLTDIRVINVDDPCGRRLADEFPGSTTYATLEPGAPWVLDALDFDARMRASRAVITGEGALDEQTLQGKLVGEIGTRARQAGVPLHAIVGSDRLDPFGKRMIDLMRVLEATTLQEMEAAGEGLGHELTEGLA